MPNSAVIIYLESKGRLDLSMLYAHELIKGVSIGIVDKFEACYSFEGAIPAELFNKK